MSELHDAISSAIKEALIKTDTLSLGELYKKIAESLSLDVEKVKEMLSGKTDVTEEQLPKVAEAIGTTAKSLKETSERFKKAKMDEEKEKHTDEQKKTKLKETVSDVFGERSELREKLKEIKKIIETNKDADTKNWMSEIIHAVIEAVPHISANSDEKAVVTELQGEYQTLKEDLQKTQLKLSTLETQVKSTKGLTETIKSAWEKQAHGKGKGLHETVGGDTDGEASPDSLDNFESRSLSRMFR